MNRQQAPQPVVRPVQVGDRYKLLDIPQGQFIKGQWYLVSDLIVPEYENQYFPVRLKPETNELQYPVIGDETLFYIAERQGNECVITDIKRGRVDSMDFSELENVGDVMGTSDIVSTNDTPTNVVGFFEV